MTMMNHALSNKDGNLTASKEKHDKSTWNGEDRAGPDQSYRLM
jgi:hypothetical protein